MKFPNKIFSDDLENGDEDQVEDAVDRLNAANARASRARTEAMELRNRLDSMENLLAETKRKLAKATTLLEEKDKMLQNVQGEAAALSQSVVHLEKRFDNLRQIQDKLTEKRNRLGL